MVIYLILLVVNSDFFCNISHIFRDFLRFCATFIYLMSLLIKFVIQSETSSKEEEEKEEKHNESLPQDAKCKWCNKKGELTYDDIRVVVWRLGMVGRWSNKEVKSGDDSMTCEECRAMEGINGLLEDKLASLEELKEAFYVFDRNEDGFISPKELWCVMRRLGLQEGLGLSDCERMIHVFDEDNDGKINFMEFKRLLENTI
ncbi:unnamed protein product [Musa banksii]